MEPGECCQGLHLTLGWAAFLHLREQAPSFQALSRAWAKMKCSFLEFTPYFQPEQDRGSSEGLSKVIPPTLRQARASVRAVSRCWDLETSHILPLVGHVESTRYSAGWHPPCLLRDCPPLPPGLQPQPPKAEAGTQCLQKALLTTAYLADALGGERDLLYSVTKRSWTGVRLEFAKADPRMWGEMP